MIPLPEIPTIEPDPLSPMTVPENSDSSCKDEDISNQVPIGHEISKLQVHAENAAPKSMIPLPEISIIEVDPLSLVKVPENDSFASSEKWGSCRNKNVSNQTRKTSKSQVKSPATYPSASDEIPTPKITPVPEISTTEPDPLSLVMVPENNSFPSSAQRSSCRGKDASSQVPMNVLGPRISRIQGKPPASNENATPKSMIPLPEISTTEPDPLSLVTVPENNPFPSPAQKSYCRDKDQVSNQVPMKVLGPKISKMQAKSPACPAGNENATPKMIPLPETSTTEPDPLSLVKSNSFPCSEQWSPCRDKHVSNQVPMKVLGPQTSKIQVKSAATYPAVNENPRPKSMIPLPEIASISEVDPLSLVTVPGSNSFPSSSHWTTYRDKEASNQASHRKISKIQVKSAADSPAGNKNATHKSFSISNNTSMLTKTNGNPVPVLLSSNTKNVNNENINVFSANRILSTKTLRSLRNIRKPSMRHGNNNPKIPTANQRNYATTVVPTINKNLMAAPVLPNKQSVGLPTVEIPPNSFAIDQSNQQLRCLRRNSEITGETLHQPKEIILNQEDSIISLMPASNRPATVTNNTVLNMPPKHNVYIQKSAVQFPEKIASNSYFPYPNTAPNYSSISTSLPKSASAFSGNGAVLIRPNSNLFSGGHTVLMNPLGALPGNAELPPNRELNQMVIYGSRPLEPPSAQQRSIIHSGCDINSGSSNQMSNGGFIQKITSTNQFHQALATIPDQPTVTYFLYNEHNPLTGLVNQEKYVPNQHVPRQDNVIGNTPLQQHQMNRSSENPGTVLPQESTTYLQPLNSPTPILSFLLHNSGIPSVPVAPPLRKDPVVVLAPNPSQKPSPNIPVKPVLTHPSPLTERNSNTFPVSSNGGSNSSSLLKATETITPKSTVVTQRHNSELRELLFDQQNQLVASVSNSNYYDSTLVSSVINQAPPNPSLPQDKSLETPTNSQPGKVGSFSNAFENYLKTMDEESDSGVKTNRKKVQINVELSPQNYSSDILTSKGPLMAIPHPTMVHAIVLRSQAVRPYLNPFNYSRYAVISKDDPPKPPVWQCVLCFKIEESKDVLLSHYEYHRVQKLGPGGDDVSPEFFQCPICLKELRLLINYERHIKDKHGLKDLSCETCKVECADAYTLSIHNASHNKNPDTFTCVNCKHFTCKDTEQLHQHIVKEEMSYYKCKVCERSFSSKIQVKQHRLLHMTKATCCGLCRKQFANIYSIMKHNRQFHSVQRTILSLMSTKTECDICKATLADNNALERHKKSHEVQESLCPFCGKVFGHPQSLTAHLIIHNEQKKFMCAVCGKYFSKSNMLTVHMRTHNGERPYECTTCGKRFTQRSTLVIHRRGHTGERPYVCPKCQRGFVSRGALRAHSKSCNTNRVRKRRGSPKKKATAKSKKSI